MNYEKLYSTLIYTLFAILIIKAKASEMQFIF